MAKKSLKVKNIVCKGKKGCGYTFEPTSVPTNKEWTLLSPMPDKDGNLTITIMATWTCPQCGKSITGALGKTKGEMTGKSKKEIVEDALKSGKEFKIEDLAKELHYDTKNVEKMINVYIKKNLASGKVENGVYYPS